MARITQQSSIHTTGTSYENEPIIKSDGASSNVMQWLSNNEASNVTISEDASNNLDLVVSAGNVAIGGSTFETWTTDQTVLQIGGNGAVRATTAAGANGYLQLIQNAYYDSTNNRWEYRDTDEVSMYQQNAGTHQFRVAASSTADNPITWTTALIIDSAGLVQVGSAGTAGSAKIYGATNGNPLTIYEDTNNDITHNCYLDGSDNAGLTMYAAGETSKVDIQTAGASYFNGGVVSFGSGVYETNGVLKENLLTNSGFDVWSNSTLENVTGTNLITGWTNGSGGDAYGTFTSSGANVTSAISDGSAGRQARSDYFTTATGKLYKMVVTLTLNSGTAPVLYIEEGDGSGYISGFGSKALVAGANTFVYEESSGGSSARFIMYNAAAASNWSCTFTHYEVTPGCVAANALAMDGWNKDTTIDVHRQHDDGGTYTKDGSFYSLKTTPTAQHDWVSWPGATKQNVEHLARFAGRTVTVGAWVKSSTASDIVLRLDDGVGATNSASHTGGGAWEWLELTMAFSPTPSNAQFQIRHTNASPGVAYISQPMLVFGSAIGSGNYSRPSGEIVVCEGLVRIQNNVSPIAADDTKVLNLEALSSGKIPKGCKAIDITGQVENSVVNTYDGIVWMATSTGQQDVRIYPTVAILGATFNGLVTCDTNGDIYQLVSEPDSSLSGLYQDVLTVHLR